MKKLMILAIGLGIALSSVSFAQDADKKMDDKKMDKKAKKVKKVKKMDKAADADKKM